MEIFKLELPKPIKEMTAEELKNYKRELFQRAKKEGYFSVAHEIATYLGKQTNCRYTKYEFVSDKLRIFDDHYGNFLSIYWDGKEVAGNHGCTELFVSGEWIEEFIKHIKPAIEERERRKAERERKEVNELCNELGIDAQI